MSFFRSSANGSATKLKITPHDPLREWRLHLYWFLGSLAAIVAILIYARIVTAPGFSDLRVERNHALREVKTVRSELEATKAKLAIAERSEQVAVEASKALEKTIAERLRSEARLKADLNFYERMLGGEQKNQGLSAFSLSLRGGEAAGVHSFTLTLAQNLRNAAVVSGMVSMALEGSADGALKTLSWATLTRGSDGGAMPFSFKYFARLEGQIIVPPGFQPATFNIRIDPENGAAITQQIPWNQALMREE